jgi:hypothetical protein
VALAVQAFGSLVALAGVVLLFDVGGAAATVTRAVTSRNLGSLEPGYAATKSGLRVYAVLVIAIGVAVAGLGVLTGAPVLGLVLFIGAGLVFIGASIAVIAGEVRTYRALNASRVDS